MPPHLKNFADSSWRMTYQKCQNMCFDVLQFWKKTLLLLDSDTLSPETYVKVHALQRRCQSEKILQTRKKSCTASTADRKSSRSHLREAASSSHAVRCMRECVEEVKMGWRVNEKRSGEEKSLQLKGWRGSITGVKMNLLWQLECWYQNAIILSCSRDLAFKNALCSLTSKPPSLRSAFSPCSSRRLFATLAAAATFENFRLFCSQNLSSKLRRRGFTRQTGVELFHFYILDREFLKSRIFCHLLRCR